MVGYIAEKLRPLENRTPLQTDRGTLQAADSGYPAYWSLQAALVHVAGPLFP